MTLRFTKTLLILIALTGCVTQPVDQQEDAQMQALSDQLDRVEKNLAANFSLHCEKNIDKLGDKIETLRKTRETTKVIEQCAKTATAKGIEGKLLLGAVEKVKLTKENLSFDARIDTGAETSSLGVFGVKRFERDGKKWVRFALSDKKDAERFEYPIDDRVRIKQSGDEIEKRIEIKINIELGRHKYKNQSFNLADRSYLDYQLLIGRSFLRDIAVVDVSRKNLQRTKK